MSDIYQVVEDNPSTFGAVAYCPNHCEDCDRYQGEVNTLTGQVRDLTNQLTLSTEVTTSQLATINRLQSELDVASQELPTYKAWVREYVMGERSNRGWCREGSNEFLTSIGAVPTIIGHQVSGSITFTVFVECEDRDDAIQVVRNAGIDFSFDDSAISEDDDYLSLDYYSLSAEARTNEDD